MTQEEKDPCLNLNDLEQKLDEALKKETPESLNEFLDSKRNQGGWIKVSDRLPEEKNKYTDYLCIMNGRMVILTFDNPERAFGDYDRDIWYLKGVVTHWQPLPEPPIE